MDAARAKVADLGDEQLDTGDDIKKFGASLNELAIVLGEK